MDTQLSQLAATPPMGWNSWNMFRGKVHESSICATAGAMLSTGLKDLGYEYIADFTVEITRRVPLHKTRLLKIVPS